MILQEDQLILTNPRDAMLVNDNVSRQCGFDAYFAITEKLIARRALLFEAQRVTSHRLPRLRGLFALFSTYCRQNHIQIVCN